MKENKIPSAEELAKILESDSGYDILIDYIKFTSFVATEFAKLHVKAALEAATEKAYIDTFSKNRNHRWVKMPEEFEFDPTNFEHKYVVNKKSILSAYPEKLIK